MKKSDGLNRRAFLQLAGIAGVAAGCSPVRTAQKLAPYLDPPLDQVPGTPVFFRTACRECAAGCGVTARTREGRVVKLEGNPEDPVSRGALCARGQAGVQELYSPDRFKGPMRRNAAGAFEPVSWNDALAAIAAALAAVNPKNVRFLSRPEPGSGGAIQREFLAALGGAASQRVVFDPFDPAATRAASATLYGMAEIPAFDLGAARTVVSFGADFLETWVSPVALTRGFASGRGRVGDDRTRLAWVGPRLSATAASADTWLRAKPGAEAAVALGLLRWLVDPANHVPTLSADAAQVFALVRDFTPAAVEALSGVSTADLARLGAELSSRRPSVLLGPGMSSAGRSAETLALAVALANHVLGNTGKTVRHGLDPLEDPPSSAPALAALLADASAGKVDVLFVHHADPAGALPGAAQTAKAIASAHLVVSFASRLDETTKHAHYILPDNHALESWADLSVARGALTLQQPAMTPLADTRAATQALLDLAAKVPAVAAKVTATDAYEYVRARVEDRVKGAPGAAVDPAAAVREAFGRGGSWPGATPAAVTPRLAALHPFGLPPAVDLPLTLVVFPTALRGDGSSGATWLKEVADVMSTVSWVAWAEVSHHTAAKLGLETGRKVALTTSAGTQELPVYVYPGILDGVIAVPLGGPEALALVSTIGAPIAVATRALGRARLPQLEGVPEPHAGALFAAAGGTEGGPKLQRLKKLEMYEPPKHPKHRWAMTIDLDKCTGCNACTVACYAENNIPVAGPERMEEGRSMAWLRVERFFEDGDPARAGFVPMLCQQCTNAPCEVVCPVDATYHTGEGLNAQVYNRCVGTRYCANNCPYKVRVFNWEEPRFVPPLHMQLNPEVNVRSKGVMEKCTFCVQRIRYAENAAREENRDVHDGDMLPACAQTCPAQAIVFGDELDATSRVAEMRKSPRGFRALEELNTQPAVTYLPRPKGGS